MNQLQVASQSRTVWTIIAMVIVNGVPAITGMLPEEYLPLVNLVLGVLAAYFRINRRV